MFKKHSKSNMKLISRSAYAFALVIPFINFVGETKASKNFSSENGKKGVKLKLQKDKLLE